MLNVLIVGLVFFFGLCFGSFFNVVVYRLNHGFSPLKGRSFCPKCKKKIPWYDNLPLVSFFLLKGKCRFCHSPISWQYPLVELATGCLTLLVIFYSRLVLEVNFVVTLYWLLITYFLIIIFVSDLRYQIIPDEVVFGAIFVSFFYSLLVAHDLTLIVSGLGASLFFLFLVIVTRGKGMGMGDVKLAGLMGLVLGYPGIIVALIVAFLTGALVGVILVLIGKKELGSQIPFGPFLVWSTWLSLFWGQSIWQYYLEKFLI